MVELDAWVATGSLSNVLQDGENKMPLLYAENGHF
jgi:hypothetical protein